MMSRGHVVCHPAAFPDEPGSAIEDEPEKELPMVGPQRRPRLVDVEMILEDDVKRTGAIEYYR
jgi:hypothetical protein